MPTREEMGKALGEIMEKVAEEGLFPNLKEAEMRVAERFAAWLREREKLRQNERN